MAFQLPLRTTLFALPSILAVCSFNTQAQTSPHWYVKPAVGVSALSDTSATASNADIPNSLISSGDWSISTDSGFYAGMGIGYQYSNGVRSELYWEYRTNDSSTETDASGQGLDGNIASNVFFVNAYYPLYQQRLWRIYLGAGVGWVQELDIDLEEGSIERSYSGDGELAYQLIGQVEYQLSSDVSVAGELRWSDVGSPSLDGEDGGALGIVDNFDYNPVSFGLSLQYRF